MIYKKKTHFESFIGYIHVYQQTVFFFPVIAAFLGVSPPPVGQVGRWNSMTLLAGLYIYI